MYKIAPRINFLIQQCKICMVLHISYSYALNNVSLLFRAQIVHNHIYITVSTAMCVIYIFVEI
jgi:hypothetical protein